MNKRKLGRTSLLVSELCLDTAAFGTAVSEETSFALLNAYREFGGSFVESVGVPSGSSAEPPSEQIVGRWLKRRGISRDQITLAARLPLARPSGGGTISFVNLIREACESSLRRLQVGHVDLLVFDWDERLVPVADVIEACDMLIRAGVARYAVARGFPAWRVVDSLHRSRLRNQCRFEAVQVDGPPLANAGFEQDALAMCHEHRLGFIARQTAGEDEALHTGAGLSGGMESEIRTAAERHGLAPAQVASAWLLRHPGVTALTISPATLGDLDEAVRAAKAVLIETDDGSFADSRDHRDPVENPLS